MDSRSAVRPDVIVDKLETSFGVIERPLTFWQKLSNSPVFRKGTILILIAFTWQFYAMRLDNPFVMPTFIATFHAFFRSVATGELLARTLYSIEVLLIGYASGLVLAAVLTALAATTRVGRDLLELLSAMLSPMPAIALLPLAMIWFGLGLGSFVFVLIHSVLWAVALNTNAGFRSVPNALRMVGMNYGLRGLRYIVLILVPAAFPSILTGLRIGWAFAWRTLIAAELVFGVSSQAGGLGWFIFEKKNMLDIPTVFAGLFMVIAVGLVIEYLVFGLIERKTIRKWGMQQ
jgi:NitT/TauT family transport system permease protein